MKLNNAKIKKILAENIADHRWKSRFLQIMKSFTHLPGFYENVT